MNAASARSALAGRRSPRRQHGIRTRGRAHTRAERRPGETTVHANRDTQMRRSQSQTRSAIDRLRCELRNWLEALACRMSQPRTSLHVSSISPVLHPRGRAGVSQSGARLVTPRPLALHAAARWSDVLPAARALPVPPAALWPRAGLRRRARPRGLADWHSPPRCREPRSTPTLTRQPSSVHNAGSRLQASKRAGQAASASHGKSTQTPHRVLCIRTAL